MLAANRDVFAAAYGGSNLVFDTFSGALPPAGQLLSLIQPGADPSSDLAVAQVRYGSAAPWPGSGGASGSSLQLINSRQDNWRVGNWAFVRTNTSAAPRWIQVTATLPATSSTFLLYLGSAGDIYIDDVQLVDANGFNRLVDGDFESPLAGAWSMSPSSPARS